jgi:hypothetical protein
MITECHMHDHKQNDSHHTKETEVTTPEARAGPDNGPTFYLGTHHPSWLRRTDVPLFISRRRLAGRKTLPRARGPWALDSGGFQELTLHGRWTLTPREYVREVRRYASEIGNLRFAAAMDWLCGGPHNQSNVVSPVMWRLLDCSRIQGPRYQITSHNEWSASLV